MNRRKLSPETGMWAALKVMRASGTSIFVSSVVINIAGLAVPITLMQVYDRIIPNHSEGTLLWLVVGCSIAIFFETSLRLCRDHISDRAGASYQLAMNTKFFNRILESPMLEVAEGENGETLETLGSIAELRSVYCGQLLPMLCDLPFVGVYLATMAFVNESATYFLVMLAAFLFFTVAWLNVISTIRKNARFQARRRVLEFIEDVFAKMHLIKSFACEEQILRRFERLELQNSTSQYRSFGIDMIPGNIGAIFANVAMFGVIAFGAKAVMEGHHTLGILTATMILSTRAMDPLTRLAMFWLRLGDIRRVRVRLQEVLDLPTPSYKAGLKLPQGMDWSIYIEDVYFRFPGQGKLLFKKLNLGVPQGKMVGIVASRSEGATTLLQILNGTLVPDRGTVWLGELALHDVDHRELYGRISYVPATAALFKGTVLENISQFNPRNSAKALNICAEMELDERVSQLSKGYNTQVDRESNNSLPRSLIQFIALARALVTEPDILLLDKADSGLDHAALSLFAKVLERIKGRCTIVVVSDRVELLERADKVFRLQGGQIGEVEKGNPIAESLKVGGLHAAS